MRFTFEMFSAEDGGVSVHHGQLADARSREDAAEHACFAFKGMRTALAAQGPDRVIPTRVVAYDAGVEFWRRTESEQANCA